MAYMKDSTGRRLDSFPAISAPEADAKYASLTKMRAGTLAALVGTLREPFPSVASDVPTVTHATSTGLSGAVEVVSAQDDRLTKIGHPGTWNSQFGQLRVSGPGHALGFIVGSATFEVHWYNPAADNVLWIWVDGQPITARPSTPSGLTANTLYSTLTFQTAKVRRVEFWAQNNDSWMDVRVPMGSYVAPLPRALRVAEVGDSFFAGSDGSFVPTQKSSAYAMGRALGAQVFNASVGGTGYATSNTSTRFGEAERVGLVASIPDLDLIVMSGSVNDDSRTGVQAAASAAFAAYKSACPGVPIIVFGPQPSNATDTISAARQANIAAVRAAADAAPNVLAFIDMVGSAAALPGAWSSSTSYPTGTRVTYKGSIWEAANGAGGSVSGAGETPGASIRWKLVTFLYTGTGRVGSTAGDGTRDTVLYSDSVHPTETGSYLMGLRQAGEVLRVLQRYAFVGAIPA